MKESKGFLLCPCEEGENESCIQQRKDNIDLGIYTQEQPAPLIYNAYAIVETWGSPTLSSVS